MRVPSLKAYALVDSEIAIIRVAKAENFSIDTGPHGKGWTGDKNYKNDNLQTEIYFHEKRMSSIKREETNRTWIQRFALNGYYVGDIQKGTERSMIFGRVWAKNFLAVVKCPLNSTSDSGHQERDNLT